MNTFIVNEQMCYLFFYSYMYYSRSQISNILNACETTKKY